MHAALLVSAICYPHHNDAMQEARGQGCATMVWHEPGAVETLQEMLSVLLARMACVAEPTNLSKLKIEK